MAEYIKREDVLREYDKEQRRNGPWSFETLVESIPAADVAKVVHGQWDVKVGMNFFRERICPVCTKRIESNFWNYCPNCGARMDGGQDG